MYDAYVLWKDLMYDRLFYKNNIRSIISLVLFSLISYQYYICQCVFLAFNCVPGIRAHRFKNLPWMWIGLHWCKKLSLDQE